MNTANKKQTKELTEHFFRTEYGKIVAVITKYIGVNNVETAEDIVQETLLKAVDYWEQNGIPPNPKAWLYTTAKNTTLNILKRKKLQTKYNLEEAKNSNILEQLDFSNERIKDEQLKMMLACCHPSISENSQIALILKILCGFSISEIASAFFSSTETINKRLVRGRKQLRKNNITLEIPKNLNEQLESIYKTIYLLFNEGYSPAQKNELIRIDLCLEAIRLTELLANSTHIKKKANCYALLALMYLNASRFEARINTNNSIIEMEQQDRTKWNQDLIQRGFHYLNLATKENTVSKTLILASISANYCIAPNFLATNWEEILSLYDKLIQLEDSPIIRLNRSVIVAKAKGNRVAIKELQELKNKSDIEKHPLFHATIAEFFKQENEIIKAIEHLKKAISFTKNERDLNLLEKKLTAIVPIS